MSAEPNRSAGPHGPGPARLPLGCDGCGSSLVQPLRWKRVGPARWELLLRCPECEAVVARMLDDDAATVYDDEFDRATNRLAADVRELAQAVFESEIEDFAAQLHAGLVIADDFA